MTDEVIVEKVWIIRIINESRISSDNELRSICIDDMFNPINIKKSVKNTARTGLNILINSLDILRLEKVTPAMNAPRAGPRPRYVVIKPRSNP